MKSRVFSTVRSYKARYLIAGIWLSLFLVTANAASVDDDLVPPVHQEQESSNDFIVELLNQVAKVSANNADQAWDMLEAAEDDVILKGARHELSEFYQVFSEVSGLTGKYRDQLKYAEKGLRATSSKPGYRKASLMYLKARAYQSLADYESSIATYQAALLQNVQLNDPRLQAQGEQQLAVVYRLMEHYSEAFTRITAAHSQVPLLKDKSLISAIYNEMGRIYSALGDNKESIRFHKKALALIESQHDYPTLIETLTSLAQRYVSTGQPEAAVPVYDRVLKESFAWGSKIHLHRTYLGLAEAAIAMERFDMALKYLERAGDYLTWIQDELEQASYHFVKTQVYQGLEQTARALDEILTAENLIPEQIRDSAHQLPIKILLKKAELQFEHGEYDAAWVSIHQYIDGLKGYHDKEIQSRLVEMKEKFDSQRHASALAKLEQDYDVMKSQRDNAQLNKGYFLLLIIISLIMLATLIVMFGRYRRMRTALNNTLWFDPLTGVYNRHYLNSSFDSIAMEARMQKRMISVIKLNVDGLKQVNHLSGCSTGDDILKVAADICKSRLHDKDFLFRTGGDEFLYILPGTTRDQAENLAQGIKDAFHKSKQLRYDYPVEITASFGIIQTQSEFYTLDELLAQAEGALEKARQQSGKSAIFTG